MKTVKFEIVFDVKAITRDDVRGLLEHMMPKNMITTGGHHVAAHDGTGHRIFIIKGDGEDW